MHNSAVNPARSHWFPEQTRTFTAQESFFPQSSCSLALPLPEAAPRKRKQTHIHSRSSQKELEELTRQDIRYVLSRTVQQDWHKQLDDKSCWCCFEGQALMLVVALPSSESSSARPHVSNVTARFPMSQFRHALPSVGDCSVRHIFSHRVPSLGSKNYKP